MKEPKLIVVTKYNDIAARFETQYVIDNREKRLWTKEEIQERGIEDFLGINDVRETLNWSLNGDEDKFSYCETDNYLTAFVYQ